MSKIIPISASCLVNFFTLPVRKMSKKHWGSPDRPTDMDLRNQLDMMKARGSTVTKSQKVRILEEV